MEVFQTYNGEVKVLVGKTKSKGTYQKYERTRKHFQEFLLKKYKRKDIKLVELNHMILHDFEIYLKTVGKCGHNTTSKFMHLIRTICVFAHNE